MVALDGVEYHSSHKIKCNYCNTRTHQAKKGESATYYHSMICAAIIHPHKSEVIALRPEFITNKDGQQKQDCENAAAKRWIVKNTELYKDLKVTILGDDLYSKEPICLDILKHNMHFILTCKPQSHKTLYEFISGAEVNKKALRKKEKNKAMIYNYRYINDIPIKDGKDVLHVNWLEVVISEAATQKVLYRNSFVTSHQLSDDNVEEIAKAARARWKIENENNNVLKTKGYNFEHNYGHGKKNLAANLAILTLVAFLFHTIALLLCNFYNAAAKKKGSRQRFYNTLKVITSYLLFASWKAALNFIANPPNNLHYTAAQSTKFT